MAASEILILLALILCVLWMVPMIRYLLRRWRSRDWPVVPGTIQRGQVLRRGEQDTKPSFTPVCLGTLTRSMVRATRVCSFLVAGDEETAQNLQKQGAVGNVNVRYNPRKPEISFLQEKELLGRQVIQNPLWFG